MMPATGRLLTPCAVCGRLLDGPDMAAYIQGSAAGILAVAHLGGWGPPPLCRACIEALPGDGDPTTTTTPGDTAPATTTAGTR